MVSLVIGNDNTLETGTLSPRSVLPSRQSFVEYKGRRFLITDAPSDIELRAYTETLKKFHVRHVVRVCKPSYNAGELASRGFKVHEWAYQDGGIPPQDIVNAWLKLVDVVFDSPLADPIGKETIAVHCQGGLGRAPVLVALALIELGMEPVDAIGLIRIKRRGAINSRQVQELIRYQRRDTVMRRTSSKNKNLLSNATKIFGRRRNSRSRFDDATEASSESS